MSSCYVLFINFNADYNIIYLYSLIDHSVSMFSVLFMISMELRPVHHICYEHGFVVVDISIYFILR